MSILLISLRIIHIFAGVFWVGVAFFNIYFLQPTVAATGAEGQKVMRHLMQHTRFTGVTYAVATLNLLSGLILYWILSGFHLSFLTSGYGLVITIGSAAGLIAWLVAVVLIRDIFNKMAALGQQIQAQGGPPTPDQASRLGALGAQLTRIGVANIALMTIALVGMSAAQYSSF